MAQKLGDLCRGMQQITGKAEIQTAELFDTKAHEVPFRVRALWL